MAQFDIKSAEAEALIKELSFDLIQAYYEQKPGEGERLELTANLAGLPAEGTPERAEFTKYLEAIHREVQARVQEAINTPIYGEEKHGDVKVPFTISLNATQEKIDSPAVKLELSSLGGTVKRLAVAASIVGLTMFGASCKKVIQLPDKNINVPCPDCYTDKITIGDVGVYYNKLNTIAGDARDSIRKYDDIIVNPGENSPGDAAAAGISRAKGYFSPVTLGGGDLGTSAIYAQIQAIDAAGLAANDPSKYGFVRDASGNPLKSTFNGVTPVINWMNPAVRKIIHDYGVNLIKKYPGGAVADESDIAIYYADKAKNHGLQTFPDISDGIASYASLVDSIATSYRKTVTGIPTKGLSLLSGIQPVGSTGLELAKELWEKAPSCEMIAEGRVYLKPGQLQDAAYKQVVFDQLRTVAKIRQDALATNPEAVPVISIWMLEPAVWNDNTQTFDYKTPAMETADWCKEATDYIHSVAPNVKVHFEMNIVPTLSYPNHPDDRRYFNFGTDLTSPGAQQEVMDWIKQMRKLKQDPDLKNKGVTFNYESPMKGDTYDLGADIRNKEALAAIGKFQEAEEAAVRGTESAKEMMAQTKSFSDKLGKGDNSFAKAIAADLKKGHAAQIKAQKAEAEANKDKGIA